MFGARKNKPPQDVLATPLTLRSASGDPLIVFRPEAGDSLRHMVAGLVCNAGLPARLRVVAALREEGVTYTTLAPGTVLASDTAHTVCIVELNWWHPGMLRLLAQGSGGTNRALPPSLADRPGLAEVVRGSASLEQALMATALPNLVLVPAGHVAVEQRPVIARSDALKETIESLARRYDHLILDVPAVLATSDAIALASLGAACVIVTHHGLTPTTTVQLALDDIRHLNILGVVLNQATFATPRWILDLVPQE
ncbi:MAG: chromosome partitioning protein [Chloroflexaceae bacterium]|nr:chromosome partitioning protein [Chloroflexaceae bacterium]